MAASAQPGTLTIFNRITYAERRFVMSIVPFTTPTFTSSSNGCLEKANVIGAAR